MQEQYNCNTITIQLQCNNTNNTIPLQYDNDTIQYNAMIAIAIQ